MIAVECGIILLAGAGVGIPGPKEDIPVLGVLPALVIVLWFVGLALAGAALTVADRTTPLRSSRLLLVGIGVIGATVGARMVEVSDEFLGNSYLTVMGWLVIAASAAVAVLPRRLGLGRFVPAAALGASPFALALLAYCTVGDTEFRVSQAFIAAGHTSWPSTVTLRAAMAGEAIGGGLIAFVAVDLLLLWQVVAGARAARDFGGLLARVARTVATLFPTVLALKVTLLGIAFVAAAASDGGPQNVWVHALEDGPLSWGIAMAAAALALLGVAGAWRSSLTEAGVTRATLVVGSALILVSALPVLLASGADLAGLVSAGASDAVVEVGTFVEDYVVRWILVMAPFAIAMGGLVAFARRATRPLGLALLAFSVWSLPRAVTLLGDLIRYPEPDLLVGQPTDFVERTDQVPGWVDFVTVDAAVTALVTGLAIAWWLGRQRRIGPPALLLVLVLSTALAYPASVVVPHLQTGMVFYVALLFPVLYALLLDSATLNRPHRDRVFRLLATLGSIVLILTVVALRVANGFLAPGIPNFASVGAELFKIPLVFLLAVMAGVALADRTRTRAAEVQE